MAVLLTTVFDFVVLVCSYLPPHFIHHELSVPRGYVEEHINTGSYGPHVIRA